MADNPSAERQKPIQKKGNNTGLPDNLKNKAATETGHLQKGTYTIL